jgi:hypothetical protein
MLKERVVGQVLLLVQVQTVRVDLVSRFKLLDINQPPNGTDSPHITRLLPFVVGIGRRNSLLENQYHKHHLVLKCC